MKPVGLEFDSLLPSDPPASASQVLSMCHHIWQQTTLLKCLFFFFFFLKIGSLYVFLAVLELAT